MWKAHNAHLSNTWIGQKSIIAIGDISLEEDVQSIISASVKALGNLTVGLSRYKF